MPAHKPYKTHRWPSGRDVLPFIHSGVAETCKDCAAMRRMAVDRLGRHLQYSVDGGRTWGRRPLCGAAVKQKVRVEKV